MNNIVYKIKQRLRKSYIAFLNDWHFSKRLAVIRLINEYSSFLNLKKISYKSNKKVDQYILNYLNNLIQPIINEYKDYTNVGEKNINGPIWICWWTGENDAPELVKKCIESIRKNANGHSIHFIDQNTYKKYLDVPEYILKRVQTKQMCLANFSDYLRFSLLKKYGGLWLDATIFCSNEIPDNYFNIPVFSCKSPTKDCGYISKYRWTSFCIGGWKDNILFSFFQEAFQLYWQNETIAIDYLLVDYLIEIAYRNFPIVKECIDKIPLNNLARDDLQAAMNAACYEEDFLNVMQKDTILYKLSWREHYIRKTDDGKNTIYNYFLNMKI